MRRKRNVIFFCIKLFLVNAGFIACGVKVSPYPLLPPAPVRIVAPTPTPQASPAAVLPR